MSRLQELGIIMGADKQHVRNAEQAFMPAAVFADQAASLLDRLGPVVMEDVIPKLGGHFGRWNPAGFMAFPLGMHSLGSLRLHVWPSNIPRTTGPNIHSHAWHLSSLVLKGTYRDTLFDFETFEAPQGTTDDEPLPRLYKSRLGADGREVLATNGHYVRPIPVSRRAYDAGEKHFIPTGIPHLTQIPAEQTTATLVINSPAFAEASDVVLYPDMEQANSPTTRQRGLVGYTAALLARNRILSQAQ